MIRRPPRPTRTDTLVPYTTLFRSLLGGFQRTIHEPLAPEPQLVDGRFLADRGHHVLERPRLGRVIEHVASCDAPDACSASYRVESMEPLGIVRAPAERQGEVAADAKRRSQIGEVSDRIRVGKVDRKSPRLHYRHQYAS